MGNFQLPTPNFQFPIPNFQRTRAFVVSAFAVAALGMAVLPAVAHHSFAAEFDENKPVKLTGTVTKLEWTNPHIWFFIDVKNPDGTVTNWGLEMASPNNLLRAGWKRDSMKVGDSVAVEARQARDGSSNANAQTVTLTSTGQRLFAGSPVQPAQ
jgi:hypothetical protein